MTPSTPEMVRHASGWSIVWGVLLIVFGLFAISSPWIAALAVNVFIAWLILLAGIVHLVLAFHTHSARSVIWKLLVGVAYLFFGVYLIRHPVLGVVSLALVLALLFLVEGLLDLGLFLKMRHLAGSGWVFFDAIVTLLLAFLIYIHWPSSSAWVIGTLVGISMIISGATRVMISMAARKVMTRVA